MSQERRIRQSGLIDENILHTPITVVGAGGIGSLTVMALTKVGFDKILVIDPDTVEEHNLPNQFFRLQDIGKSKVAALAEIVKEFEGIDIDTIQALWDIKQGEECKGIVISAVDSMRARTQIYDSIASNRDVIGFVDGRMGGNQLEVYTVRFSDRESKKMYRKTLWSDGEAAQTRCTEKAVMYNVLTIASWITNQTRLMLQGKELNTTLILDLENMILVCDKPTIKRGI